MSRSEALRNGKAPSNGPPDPELWSIAFPQAPSPKARNATRAPEALPVEAAPAKPALFSSFPTPVVRGWIWPLAAGCGAALVVACGVLVAAAAQRPPQGPDAIVPVVPEAEAPAPKPVAPRPAEGPKPPPEAAPDLGAPDPAPAPEAKAVRAPEAKEGPGDPKLAGRGKGALGDGLPGRARGRPMAVVAKAPAAAPAGPRRRQRATEEELRKQLAEVPEIGLGNAGTPVLNAYAANLRSGAGGLTDASPLLRVRPDLQALPLRKGASSQLGPKAARNLELLSRKLRLFLNAAGPALDAEQLAEALRKERRGKRPEWLRAEAVPALMQALMHEEVALRRMLVDLLSEVPESKATVALAQRAVFDLDEDVRLAATKALRGRKAADYRPVLLKALRHPWAPAADHAAEALVDLRERSAIPHLIRALKEPGPAAPRLLPSKINVVRELVRVNHANNCLMCHPPATAGGEPCLGVDPVVTLTVEAGPRAAAFGRALEGIGSGGGYDQGCRAKNMVGGPGRPGGRGPRTVPTQVPALIRGDITFVQQDFSVLLPADRPGAGLPVALPPRPVRGVPERPGQPRQVPGVPERAGGSRYDYVVRTRPVTPREATLLREAARKRPDYPQREATLHALRELTGQDAGKSAKAWADWWESSGKPTGRALQNLMPVPPARRASAGRPLPSLARRAAKPNLSHRISDVATSNATRAIASAGPRTSRGMVRTVSRAFTSKGAS